MTDKVLNYVEDGEKDKPILVFLHGWPDSPSLFDHCVERLKSRYRCIRITYPNYESRIDDVKGIKHEELTARIMNTINKLRGDRKVSLVGHDWGAFWGMWIEAEHPEVFERVALFDVGRQPKKSIIMTLFIIFYQWILIFAYLVARYVPVVGAGIGTFITRTLATFMKAPGTRNASSRKNITAFMNYPYLYMWMMILSGKKFPYFKRKVPVAPFMFGYGTKKPSWCQFHRQSWLDQILAANKENRVVAFKASHWMMSGSKQQQFTDELDSFF